MKPPNLTRQLRLAALAGAALILALALQWWVGAPNPTPPAPEAGPALGTHAYNGGVAAWRAMGAFLLVVAIIVAGGLLARRWLPRLTGRQPGSGASLTVNQRFPLGDRCSLVTVDWEGRRYLLGQSGHGFQLLDSRPLPPAAPGTAPAPPTPTPDFSALFTRLLPPGLPKGGAS